MYALCTLRRLHRMSADHRTLIQRSGWLGCFACGRHFGPVAITKWCDDDDHGVGQTALCPGCGNNTVIGDAGGHAITDFLLAALHEYFGTRLDIRIGSNGFGILRQHGSGIQQ